MKEAVVAAMEFPARMTDQELFDTVARHLFEQGEPAIRPGTTECRYRVVNGDGSFDKKRCAIGRCFPDSEYNSLMESTNILGLLDSHRFEQLEERFKGNSRGLLDALQSTHDHHEYNEEINKYDIPVFWKSTAAMKSELTRIAQSYGLDASVLKGLSFADGR